jgi:hypothetical protein
LIVFYRGLDRLLEHHVEPIRPGTITPLGQGSLDFPKWEKSLKAS